jgi:glycosyltransferase involved in cell wall biosynthesis/ubiquinone/menaquinone biosynthesis C-methylase UbiE
MRERLLSVVMPCYNEAGTLTTIAARVLASPYTAELIIVDDGSTDQTLEEARSLDDPRVRVIAQGNNRGKGAALRRGFAEVQHPLVIVQDADLEYDPADYDQVLAPLLEDKADVVYGSRFLAGRPHRVLYYWHSVGNKFLTTLSNMFTNLNLTDMETCYKAFRREVIQSFYIEEDRFGFEPEITAKVSRGGWRIYEVGISYAGRTYGEGKKIGWRDGLRASYCIVRYSGLFERKARRLRQVHPPAQFDEADVELAEILDNLADGSNYADWIASLAEPWLGARVLEVGAGHGTLTWRLRSHASTVVATELSARAADRLRDRYADDKGVEVICGDIETVTRDAEFDTIVVVNVLEHIEDDEKALRQMASALPTGGHLVLYVPAFEALYSDFDRRIGHFRRYSKHDLRAAALASGLDLAELRYVNSIGAIAWWVVAKQLNQIPTQAGLVQLYDRLAVPVVRAVEAAFHPPFGQSVLCVLRKPSGPTSRAD